MIDFLCNLWPYLAGGLIGWLLAGWMARRFKHSEPPVEKQIDNPQHLALISKLENENKEIAGLKTKLSGFQSSTAASGTTKTVDNPVHLQRISELEAQVNSFKSSSSNAPQAAMSASSSTSTVDNSAHLKRISELEAQVSSLKSSSNSSNTAQSAMSGTSKTVDNPEHVKRIKELEARVSSLQHGPEIDLAAAKAAGFKLRSADDLTAIEGIGPKINDLIKADGVKSFSQLADTPVASIQGVLDNAGSRYKIANPGTWPDQANLAANNRWEALGALQDVLVGGVYPNSSVKSLSDGKSAATSKSAKPKNISTSTSATTKPKSSVKKQAATSVESSGVDKAAAKAAGFRVKSRDGRDDFTIVEGVGPKINDLIHDADIHSYSDLGKTKVETIQKILTDAGPRYALAKPGTWPAQADMAAANKWEALKAWQDDLDGGK